MIPTLALFGSAVALYSNTTASASAAGSVAPTTKTVENTKFTTIPCEGPTTLTHGGSTLTVSQATTLTLSEVCDEECTKKQPQATTAPTTKTVENTKYTTIPCEGPTTLTHGGSTLTVSKATTLTLSEVCDEECYKSSSKAVSTANSAAPTSSAPASKQTQEPSLSPVASSAPSNTTAPHLANGAAMNEVAGVAGVAAAVAFLL